MRDDVGYGDVSSIKKCRPFSHPFHFITPVTPGVRGCVVTDLPTDTNISFVKTMSMGGSTRTNLSRKGWGGVVHYFQTGAPK